MRKIRKVRFLACVMCAALVLGSLAGCGGVSTDTAQKDGQKNTALVNALRKSKEADSVDMGIHLKSSFKSQYIAGSHEESRLDFEGTVSRFRAPFHMKSTIKAISETAGVGVKQKLETYAAKENDKYVVYVRTIEDEEKSVVGAWEKSEGDDQDVLYNELAFLCVSADDLDDNASRYTRLDYVEDHGITYQAYKYIMTSEEVFKWMQKLYPMGDLTDDIQELDQDLAQKLNQEIADAWEQLGDTEMTVLVDPEKEELYQWSWDFGKNFQIYMNAYFNFINYINNGFLNDAYDEEDEDSDEDPDEASDDEDAEEEATADEDAESEENEASPGEDDTDFVEMVLDCSMDYTVTFSNWNAASEFEIPEEVIKEAENTKSKQEQESEDE